MALGARQECWKAITSASLTNSVLTSPARARSSTSTCGLARLRRSRSRRRFYVTGQHANAILTELGYSAERIAGLRGRKVVG